jgi:hypothetical protein
LASYGCGLYCRYLSLLFSFFLGGFMTFYQKMRVLEALLVWLLSVICFGFLHLTLAGLLCFLAGCLYFHLALKGGGDE